MAFALESGPSNKVGYVKIDCSTTGGTATWSYTPFGLPFKFWTVPTGNVPTYGTESRKPSSILGSQANCTTSPTAADKIQRQDNGQTAFRYGPVTNCVWSGSLETAYGTTGGMDPGRAYWYGNKTASLRTIVLAGEADTTAVGIPAITITAASSGTVGAYTPYSWRDPRAVGRSKLGLVTAGFLGSTSPELPTAGDEIVRQGTGTTWRRHNGVWSGGSGVDTLLVPGKAYWVHNKHNGHPWTYTYTASGAAFVNAPDGGKFEVVPTELLKLTPPVAKSKAVKTRTVER